jgi:hypothetical protein
MMRMGAMVLVLAAFGCGAKDAPEPNPANLDEGALGAKTLASSVEVEVGAKTVRLVFHVTNPTNRPVPLEFTSGQRYDFAIRTSAGTDVWTWSADKMFAQALGTDTLAAGATVDYTTTWAPGANKGSFVAIATLTSTNHPIREQAAFSLQ